MIRAYKKEILYFFLLSSFVLFVYLLCDWQQSKKIENFLELENKKHSKISFIDHRSLILKELKRRAFYYLFYKQDGLFISYVQNIYKGNASIDDLSFKFQEKEGLLDFDFIQNKKRIKVELSLSERVLSEAFSSYFKENSSQENLGLSFCLESPISEISSKTLQILKDVSSLRDDSFIIPDRDGFMYFVYPIANTSLHRVIQIEKSEIEKDFIWSIVFWGLICFFFYYLIWYFLSYKNSRLSYFHRIQFIQVITFYACFSLFWNSSTLYYDYEQQVRTRKHERDILEKKSLKKLHFSYDELREILPLEKDVIYHLIQKYNEYFLQLGNKEILGKQIVEKKSQDKEEIILLVLYFILLNLFLYFLLRGYSKFYKKASLEIINNFDGMKKSDFDNGSFVDLDHLKKSFIQTYESLKERKNKQIFLSKKIYKSLGESENNKEVFTLYLQLNDIEQIENLASKNYFAKQNYMIQIIRSVAKRQGGEVFYEGRHSYCLFFHHQRKSVSLQRSIICAMNIVNELKKDDLIMKAYVFWEKLSYSLAETKNQKDIIIQSSFNEKSKVIEKERFGIFVEKSESENLDETIFEKLAYDEYVKVLSVKSIDNHLLLLSSGSVELQKSVLDLVSLKQDDLVFESILDNISEFDESLSDQVALILITYFDDFKKRQQLLEKLKSIKETTNSFAIRIALKCYKRLKLSLSDQELEMISSLNFKEFEEDILHLCLDGESNDRASIHESRARASTTNVQAHFFILQFERTKESKYLDELFTCYEKSFNENNEQSLNYILKLFLRINLKSDNLLLSTFLNWYKKQKHLSFYLKKGLDHPKRSLVFSYLFVISALKLEDMTEVLVAKYQRTLDQELQTEILETLMLLGGDNFLIQCLR
ncbi:MAG: hypothetical protein COB02_12690 [Candidatus Cloacimonadota bacterium]|nr:MAG: hypothetical protein COB02_12690 [Candidatus Cloacimonadota bacterium]